MSETATYTWLGRNHQGMIRLKEEMSGKKKAVLWVIGLGETPLEHLEAHEMLKHAGIKQPIIYASDINRRVIEKAKKSLKEGRIIVPETILPPNKNSIKEYLESLKCFKKTHFEISPDSKITILGSNDNEGDARLATPVERPNAVICFNVLQHYRTPIEQREWAELLSNTLPKGGILMIRRPADKTETWLNLEKELKAKLKEPEEFGDYKYFLLYRK